MIPSYGKSLIDDVKLMRATRKQTSKDLELNYYENKQSKGMTNLKKLFVAIAICTIGYSVLKRYQNM